MRHRLIALALAGTVIASCAAWSATSELPADPPVDSAPCFAAIAGGDDEKITADCATLINHDKAQKPDRVRALLARAGVFVRRDEIDRAIGDYDAVLRADPMRADIFNSRGELFRKQGNRPRALADFAAALKLNSQHEAARANYKALALELEKIGAQRAVAGRPSFNCATARKPVEKAICADPALADLDREVDGAFGLVLREAGADTPLGRRLHRAHAAFLDKRNAAFGRPGYDLKAALQARLQQLLGRDGY
jgi:tetratricopeptide (TPR) repeat protein